MNLFFLFFSPSYSLVQNNSKVTQSHREKCGQKGDQHSQLTLPVRVSGRSRTVPGKRLRWAEYLYRPRASLLLHFGPLHIHIPIISNTRLHIHTQRKRHSSTETTHTHTIIIRVSNSRNFITLSHPKFTALVVKLVGSGIRHGPLTFSIHKM